MAADTREPSASASTTSPKSTAASPQNGQTEAYAAPVAPPNANAFAAGASQNTAGGKVQEPRLMDGLRSIKSSDFKEVHKKPCVRDALLTGIGGGFGIGGARAIWGGMILEVMPSCWQEADRYSDRLVRLQLGCWLVCFWFLFDVRVLPEEEVVGKRGYEKGCRSD